LAHCRASPYFADHGFLLARAATAMLAGPAATWSYSAPALPRVVSRSLPSAPQWVDPGGQGGVFVVLLIPDR
jgi:hypothetical protein